MESNKLYDEAIFKYLNVRFKCKHCGFIHTVMYRPPPDRYICNDSYSAKCNVKSFRIYSSLKELVNENAINKDYYEITPN